MRTSDKNFARASDDWSPSTNRLRKLFVREQSGVRD